MSLLGQRWLPSLFMRLPEAAGDNLKDDVNKSREFRDMKSELNALADISRSAELKSDTQGESIGRR